MLKEVVEELNALAAWREELLKQSVGKVFIRTMYQEDFCIGEGYEVLKNFCEIWFKGNVTKEKILHNIEKKLLYDDLQPDSEQTTLDIIINIGDRHVRIVEECQTLTMPPKLPELPEIVMLSDRHFEKHKEPAPPYLSKLLPYEKRRNYAKRNCWNRIRSRCW